jgi:hypothetical protein
VYCPGCGSLRALADLVHGNLPGAIGHNAMLIAFLPLALLAWVRAMTGRGPLRSRPWQVPVLVAALVVWTVLRNLPVAPFTALAP